MTRQYTIHECWYDHGQAPDDVPDLWTAEPADLFGDTPEELEWTLEHMLKATRLPALVECGDHLELAPEDAPGAVDLKESSEQE